MNNSATPGLENGQASDGSYLPDASELDTTMTGGSVPGQFIFEPDASNGEGTWYLESDMNSTITDGQASTDRPLFSDAYEPEYSESNSSTPVPGLRQVVDQSYLPGADLVDESGNFGSDPNTSTHGNNHVIDQYSFLSDAIDADDADVSGNSHDDQQVVNQSFLPDASQVNDTTMETESSQITETGRDLYETDVREGSSAQGQGAEQNNLFFRKDDGTVLAIRIEPSQGPELLRVLRGISRQTSPLAQLPALPFPMTPSTTPDETHASDAQEPPATASTSAEPSSSGSDSSRDAHGSNNASAPVLSISATHSSTLRPNMGAEIGSVDAWVDGMFSSAHGNAYDRDWMSNHDVNDEILEGTPSKHKLNLLVRHGAVVVGDKLCVTYHSSGIPVIIRGEILLGSTSANLCVRIAPARAKFDGILRSIQGPRDLIIGMNKEYAVQYDEAAPEKWNAVRLTSSSGQDFGTLFEVRQAYQVWADEKAKWAARNSGAAA